ncbi:DUF5305 domain-containing protein [Candidatus Saccharibacteria bacterium]|nr:DUF5305 domain-containing protein [Candidatus Saccharibacteria bacterium]
MDVRGLKTQCAVMVCGVFAALVLGGLVSQDVRALDDASYAMSQETMSSPAQHISQQDYEVCLVPNYFFEETCQGAGRQYLTSLTDTINLKFAYELVTDARLNYQYTYSIVGRLIVYDREHRDREIFTKEYVLQEDVSGRVWGANVLEIGQEYRLDFQKYNSEAMEFKSANGLSGEAVLVVRMKIDLTVMHGERSITRPVVLDFTVPLSRHTYNIKVGRQPDKDDILMFAVAEEGRDRSVFLSVAGASVLVAVVFGVVIVRRRKLRPKDLCVRYDEKIHKEYGRIIVDLKTPLRAGDYKYCYLVEDFDDLIDKADRVTQNILYSRLPSGRTFYAVIEGDHLFVHGCPYWKHRGSPEDEEREGFGRCSE